MAAARMSRHQMIMSAITPLTVFFSTIPPFLYFVLIT